MARQRVPRAGAAGAAAAMRTISGTEFFRNYGAVLHSVVREGPVTVTTHGRPQVVIMSPEHYAELMAAAAMVESARAKRRADTEPKQGG